MAYIGTSPTQGVRRIYNYTATASQTSFSGNDTLGISLAYADGAYIDVYQNGVLLIPTDYVATTGTTVVLDTAASENDTVQMVVYDVFGVADSVSAKDGGGFAGNISSPIVTGSTSLRTPLIEFTDGDDAIAIADGGVVTFSQAPVGAGMDLLLSTTISSAIAQFDITSTHINSTYDEYMLFYALNTVVDSKILQGRVFVGGTIVTTTIYQYEHTQHDANAGATSNGDGEFFISSTVNGNVVGEGASGSMTFHNVNSTDFPFQITGNNNSHNTAGNHNGGSVYGQSLDISDKGSVVNGFRLFYSGADGSGNTIASGTVRLYGVNK
jgi:hypothetical protein